MAKLNNKNVNKQQIPIKTSNVKAKMIKEKNREYSARYSVLGGHSSGKTKRNAGKRSLAASHIHFAVLRKKFIGDTRI